MVEWNYQYPKREIEIDECGYYLIEEDWFEDFQEIAQRCFSKAVAAPADPGRRLLFRRLIPRREE